VPRDVDIRRYRPQHDWADFAPRVLSFAVLGMAAYCIDKPARSIPNKSQRISMNISMYSASVPVFRQMLSSLREILIKTEAHATERKIEPTALLQSRLYPDMFPLLRQVQIACDFARGVSARLAGVDVPVIGDQQHSFADLQQLIDASIAFIDSIPAEKFSGSETREILTRPGTPKEKRFSGIDYLLGYGVPQFFFHITTSYALLRHAGIEIGKKDYMGQR
jgi:uncharacterized protein